MSLKSDASTFIQILATSTSGMVDSMAAEQDKANHFQTQEH